MATLASDPVKWIADQWENHCGYASAVLSGIIPDRRHLDNGGYHCSIEDLIRYGNQNDYSNTRPDDKGFNPKYGAAVDMSMSPADMKRCHDRVRRVWADKSDPRRKYVNCINTWDGSGDAVRLDFYSGAAKYASPDHKWHNHGELRRRFLLDWIAARAIVSMLKGESKATYLASISDEGDLVTTQTEFNNFFLNALRNNDIAMLMRALPWQYVGGGIPAGMSTLGVLNKTLALAADAAGEELDEATLAQMVAAQLNTLTPEQVAAIAGAAREGAASSADTIAERVLAAIPADDANLTRDDVAAAVRAELSNGFVVKPVVQAGEVGATAGS